jgi:sugar O-acyltransferase (sialic acid O-acetyltransferase NeuD family)
VTSAPVLLIGAGGHARACIDVLEQLADYTVAGLIGLPQEVGGAVLGYPVLGSDADLAALAARYGNALVALGQITTPEPRMKAFEAAQRSGCLLPVVISPKAYVSRHATIGAGSIVMHGAVVNAGAVVGRNCIINSQALVEHDAVVEDHCHVSTGARLNGGVRVGAGTFVGSNATVHHSVRIGVGSVIGMGYSVLADCGPGTRMPAERPS